MESVHYKIILLYNGRDFAGFQLQADARTVQGELETCLRKLGWQGRHILAAGRTDAGVHARGQVVSFFLEWGHGKDDLCSALNYYLPEDMAVQMVTEVAPDFHPRFDAVSRRYRYLVYCQPYRDPLREAVAWRVWPEVNIERMNSAGQALNGRHDFAAFGSPTSEGGSTIREVFSASWEKTGDEYCFDILANAYLYHMVRRIVFVLVSIGQGDAPVETVEKGLEQGSLEIDGLAPPEGLVLQEVNY